MLLSASVHVHAALNVPSISRPQTQQAHHSCSNEAFREAVSRREGEDARLLQDKLKRPLEATERSRLGISQLRGFLEQLLQTRYLESVPTILPLLEQEFRSTVRTLCGLVSACALCLHGLEWLLTASMAHDMCLEHHAYMRHVQHVEGLVLHA